MNFGARNKFAIVALLEATCSSHKHPDFQLETQAPCSLFRTNGTADNIHEFYRSRDYARGDRLEDIIDLFRFAILRTPVTCFRSCFSNRVPHDRNPAFWKLSEEAIQAGASRCRTGGRAGASTASAI